MPCKFYLHLTCHSRVFIFQKFSQQLKLPLQATSGWPFRGDPPKLGKNGLKFRPWIQCKSMHQACDVFYFIIKKHLKLSQKKSFFGFFQRFLDHALSHCMGDTLIFGQMKVLMEIHNRAKFHQDTICGCKVMNFQMLSWRSSSHEMGPFWGFLGSFSPKYDSNLLKFGPEVVHLR